MRNNRSPISGLCDVRDCRSTLVLSGGFQSRDPWRSAESRLDLGSGQLLDRKARTTRLRRNCLVLLLDHPAGRLIALKAAQYRSRNAPVGGAGAILIDDIEQNRAPLLRLRFRALAHGRRITRAAGRAGYVNDHRWQDRVRVHPASPGPSIVVVPD